MISIFRASLQSPDNREPDRRPPVDRPVGRGQSHGSAYRSMPPANSSVRNTGPLLLKRLAAFDNATTRWQRSDQPNGRSAAKGRSSVSEKQSFHVSHLADEDFKVG